MSQMVKNLPEMQETWVWSLDQEDPLEKEMATHSSILAWRTPGTEEPAGLQSRGSQRVGHDWATKTFCFSNFNNDVITRRHTAVSDRGEMERQTHKSPNSLFLAFPCLPDVPTENNLCNLTVAVTGLFISTKVLVVIIYQNSQDSYAKKKCRDFSNLKHTIWCPHWWD